MLHFLCLGALALLLAVLAWWLLTDDDRPEAGPGESDPSADPPAAPPDAQKSREGP